jgi:phosphate-selective porin OprO/OprP
MRSPWWSVGLLALLAARTAQAESPASPAATSVSHEVATGPANTAVSSDTLPRAAKNRGPELSLGDVATVRFKPGTGAVVTSKDDRFSLSIRTRMQLRYDLELPHEEDAEPVHVLQVRRMRLAFAGHAFGKHNKFYVQLGLSPRDQTGGLVTGLPDIRYNPLRDARIELDYLRDLTVVLGQMKVPFSRQRVISSGNLEMVDRSLVNEELQLVRDLGVQVLSKDLFGWNRLAYGLGVFMGEGRNAFEPAGLGMLWAARVEYLPFGQFDDYTEGDLTRSARPGLSLGVAYAFHDDAIGMRSVHGDRPADGGTTDYHHVTADLMFKYQGVSTQLAFHYRDGERTPGDAVDDAGAPVPATLPRSGVGLLAQVGYMLPWCDLQVVGRYATVGNPDPQASSLSGRSELGGGFGYYFGGHMYKVQLDYTRLWDQDGSFRTGTDRVRAQVQLSL